MGVENESQRQALEDSFNKATRKIEWAQGLPAYHIRAELGRFAEAIADIDPGLFDVVPGTSEEHGDFDFLAIRVPELMHDWLILPDGQMFGARVTQANPNIVDLDTLEFPEDKKIIDDRVRILTHLSEEFGFNYSAR